MILGGNLFSSDSSIQFYTISAMAQFITTKHNKFENKTTTEGAPCLLSQSKNGKTRWYFNLRHISMPDHDDLVIDVRYLSPDWFFLKNGDMIINIDGIKNITLEPHESYSDVGREQGAFEQNSTVICEENCFYNLTKEELKEMCEANQLEIQVSGGSGLIKQMNAESFRLYSRAFYNFFYDNSTYKEALKEYQKLNHPPVIVSVFILLGVGGLLFSIIYAIILNVIG